MHRPILLRAVRAFVVTVSISSCATVDPRPDYERAAAEIRSATGAMEVFDPDAPVLSDAEIRRMLEDGLGLEEATRLALLDNRRLQAGFFALGVARAEYVQSGLMRNPSLSLALFFPDDGGTPRWTADFLATVSELWEIPLRKKAAGERVEQQILELARLAGELVFRTEEAYLETVATRSQSSLARESADLARRSRAAVGRQVQEGMATRSDENLAESVALVSELAATRAERDEAQAARRLAALLSLQEDVQDVVLTDALPAPTGTELASAELVEQSLRHRLDLRAATRALAAAEADLALERRRRSPELSAGVSVERPEGDGSIKFLLGPSATVEIPLFDQNQAQVSRAEFRLAELQKEREALVAEVTQEVRAAADKAAIAQRAALFASEQLVPQAERAAVLTQTAVELGDTLVLSLLEAQRALIEARRTRIDALVEAARSRVELERALGAPLESLQ